MRPRISYVPDMDLSLLQGLGLEVSRTPRWPGLPHRFREPDNLYALRPDVAPESLDFLVDEDLLETRYYPILLQEWWFSLKPGGRAIIRSPASPRDFGRRFPAARAKFEIERGGEHVVLRKWAKALADSDSMERWTFGIPTNYSRPAWLERCVESIYAQGILRFEVIICGTYGGRLRNNLRHIEFKERDDLGWITRKKNIICSEARYENIAVMHDRIVLDPDWHAGMKRYGDYFEMLSCRIRNERGERETDWMTWGGPLFLNRRLGLLEYGDWDPYVYVDGGFCALKKRVWARAPWDEDYFWGEGEDIVLAHRMTREGVVIRFNGLAGCLSLSSKGRIPVHRMDPALRGPRPVTLGPYTARCLADDGFRLLMDVLRALRLYRSLQTLSRWLRRRIDKDR
ncbi:MAG: glycosyltransferase family A protein [Verrucomicrobiota bacterium]|nr:glycosyltransferase family A protein [Verrucomicrobiota bacterium]